MPPRKQQAAEDPGALTQDQQVAQNQHLKLLNKALKTKVLLEPDASQTAETLKPTKVLIKSNGKDITKKSSVRRNRYMLVINGRLAPAAAGKLGTLAKLDTKNPVLYVDFPHGRLKFFGTLVFPKNKYMVLKTGQGSDILCEDVFENLVVFSEAWWVGTLQENPHENKLPLPEVVWNDKKHTQFDYCYGAGVREGAEPPGSQKLPSAAAAATAFKPGETASQEAVAPKRTLQDRDDSAIIEEELKEQENDDNDDEALGARLKRRKTNTDGSQPVEAEIPSGLKAEQAADKTQEIAKPEAAPVDVAEVKPEARKNEDSPVRLAPYQSKGRKAIFEGTPSTPAEAPARRESLRRTSTKRMYVEKSDDEDHDNHDCSTDECSESEGKVSAGSAEGDKQDKSLGGSQKAAKRSKTAVAGSQNEVPIRSKGSRAVKQAPAKKSKGRAEAGPGKGSQNLKLEDDSAIVLDDDTPAKPKPAEAPQPPSHKQIKKGKAAPRRKGAPPAVASNAVTVDLLDGTPEKGTPSQRPTRSAGAAATKRLAALRGSGAGLQEDEVEDKNELNEASESGTDGSSSDFSG